MGMGIMSSSEFEASAWCFEGRSLNCAYGYESKLVTTRIWTAGVSPLVPLTHQETAGFSLYFPFTRVPVYQFWIHSHQEEEEELG